MLKELKTNKEKRYEERIAFSKGRSCKSECSKGGDDEQGDVYAEGKPVYDR